MIQAIFQINKCRLGKNPISELVRKWIKGERHFATLFLCRFYNVKLLNSFFTQAEVKGGIVTITLKEDMYPSIIDTIDNMEINTLFARSVLKKDVGGYVYANSREEPFSFYIVHPYGMTLLFGDSSNSSFCNELKDYFRTITKDEWLQAYPSSWYPYLRELVKEGWYMNIHDSISHLMRNYSILQIIMLIWQLIT